MTKANRPAIYTRISDDREDERGGVDRQDQDTRALVARLGWGTPVPYEDNDTSAFKKKKVILPDGQTGFRVPRPVFRQMLADLQSGVVDGLVVYDLDRIAKDMRDLEDLIDVVEGKKVPTASVTGSLDLSTNDGITVARFMVAIGNKSSRDTSRRVRRKHEQLAEQGKPGGGGRRAYGYLPDGVTVIEHEAEVIRDIAQLVINGVPLRGIATNLTDRGVPTVYGGKWNGRSVHSVVSKARVAGRREFRGQIVGDANWPAILDRDTWESVLVSLSDRAKGSTNRLVRWCSGVLRCGLCGRGLTSAVKAKGAGHRYWCATPDGGCGRIAIDSQIAEDKVETVVLKYLGRPDVLHDLTVNTSAGNVSHARAELKADQARLRQFTALCAKREITMAEYLFAKKDIEARMAQWTGVVHGSAPGVIRNLLKAHDLPAYWAELSPAEKRTAVNALFPLGFAVAPHDRANGGKPDPGRVTPVEPDQDASQ